MFRDLEPGERKAFQTWARENFKHTEPPSPLWHPVVREEWDHLVAVADFKAFQEKEDPEAAQAQWLIDSGVWGLEGSVGRHMAAMLEQGRCVLGPTPAHDFWGNRIPAEYEVEDGTKGSLEYALEQASRRD